LDGLSFGYFIFLYVFFFISTLSKIQTMKKYLQIKKLNHM